MGPLPRHGRWTRWPGLTPAFGAFWVVLLLSLAATGQGDAEGGTPEIRAGAVSTELFGRPVTRIEVKTRGNLWERPVVLRRVRPGDTLTAELARRALEELSDSGRYAELAAEAEADGSGAVLRLLVQPRRIVAGVRTMGRPVPEDDVLRALALEPGSEVTATLLAASRERVRALLESRGYRRATVAIEPIDTDDEMRVVLSVRIDAGQPLEIGKRRFVVYPAPGERMQELARAYGPDAGDPVDEEELARADREEEELLRKSGWHGATVRHRIDPSRAGAVLTVDIQSGPLVRVRFEGNAHFDAPSLTDALDLDENEDRAPSTLAARVEEFYLERGFLDAKVTVLAFGKPSDPENDLVLRVHEGEVVHVAQREYPCLSGERDADGVGEEIDSFLSETLPGTGLIGPVDPAIVDSTLGPRSTTGARPSPQVSNPWRTYVPEVYERATRHLQELYRSEGYLSAVVGPVVPMRRACDPRSPPGSCRPIGVRVRPPVHCPVGSELPVAEEPGAPSCTPDARRGVRCEAEVFLHIPVKLGPRAILWDVAFDGNRVLVEKELGEASELKLGEPFSQAELEKARRHLLDEYGERGFAFASIEPRLELSPDRTRARARFVISEREPVRVRDIVVRGANRTNESRILSRVAFEPGDLYRRSAVRATEERLATLGVFSSATVSLEDPDVFARDKVVIITVRERPPQYLDVRPGFSTGDGFRITFEYGHRNIGGEAIRLTLRVQLGLLPDFLIFEDEVRQRFDQLSLVERLERRNTASVEFPEIGLGPLFPLTVDAVDVRDNSRDFGLTKEAGILTLSYRPTTRFVAQLGGSLELNAARIFASDIPIEQYLQAHPQLSTRLRVPDGTTYAVAERANVTWDRRDDPFNATRGTFISASVEHVRAAPFDDSAHITSDFVRIASRSAGYLRLSDKGLALALSFRWGYNHQLASGAQTYPDRLFFFGGVDTIRGFIQDSVIPEDLAERILADQGRTGVAPEALLTPQKVPIRGGNVLLNPRAELRIPLVGALQTAVFLDTGNLWLDRRNVDPTRLRYAAGSGLRATTPVGPLALDIGMNLDRRAWEDPFAFHFSIGLF